MENEKKEPSALEKLTKVLGVKLVIAVVIIIPILIFLTYATIFSPSGFLRNVFRTTPGIQRMTVNVFEDVFHEVFRISTLEIATRNSSKLEIIPGGLINPGVLTIELEYDSTVSFGIRNAHQIRMRRIGDVMFITESSIDIEVTSSAVRNFNQTGISKSNPFLRMTNTINNQIFEAQRNYEATAVQRLDNEQNRNAALVNFKKIMDSLGRALGLEIIWE